MGLRCKREQAKFGCSPRVEAPMGRGGNHADVDNPTSLSMTPDGSRIYANSEVFTWRDGTVPAYSLDRGSSTLTYLNKQPSLGCITAHNAISRDGTKLLAPITVSTPRAKLAGAQACCIAESFQLEPFSRMNVHSSVVSVG
ncbi:beta-propeller fold lactonase family protein [Mesorhizobium calcicola]|uniref:Beta-propeller fold lactonase family protein n=1 Tax=Mesorhizobium calcicola TaxID=1300310 RepID=A0ABW4WH63_9HYPH